MPQHPRERRFHLRYSTDPIFLAASKDLRASPEAQATINDSPPYATGDAALMRSLHRGLDLEAKRSGRPCWVSIRDADTQQVVSIEEIRLLAVLFCDNPEDEESEDSVK